MSRILASCLGGHPNPAFNRHLNSSNWLTAAETLTRAGDLVSFARMGYVLEQTRQQQVLALGRLGWRLNRIATATQIDRATVTRYLRTAGVPVRRRGRPSEATANVGVRKSLNQQGCVLVSRLFVSWNHTAIWLRAVGSLRRAP